MANIHLHLIRNTVRCGLLALGIIAIIGNRASLFAGEETNEGLPFKHAIAAANDPWIFAVPSMGVVYDVKEGRILDFCKNGKLTTIERVAPRTFVEPVQPQTYEQCMILSPVPTPVSKFVLSELGGMKETDFLRATRAGAILGFTGGVLVTPDYKIYFWQLEAVNTMGLTSDGKKWWFLQSVPKPAEATGLSYELDSTVPQDRSYSFPMETLSPPLHSDVASISNFPAIPTQFLARYVVDNDTVLRLLRVGKKVKRGIDPFAPVHQSISQAGYLPQFGARARSSFHPLSEVKLQYLGSQSPIEAQGVLVTKAYKIYFWRLHGDDALYLTDGKDDCLLVTEQAGDRISTSEYDR